MSYFQIAVFPVPSGNRDAYQSFTTKMSPLFKEYGALQIFEGWGSMVPEGDLTSLPLAVKLEEGETVCTSFIEWPDAATAEACMAAMASDARFAEAGDMPFDGKRMIFGGFETLLKL
ncbi:DUF1428 domain-containing protein [Celeribacter neptunius]|uniref:Uncharacterized conserved protein YbaA, DUF1428 family n=1 Tax=Celeribacter neptunius TaxID=588602 RepID=A0A1I3ITR7_9RHOB|nr:DUF1428 domain-containing protein [Celeribacter neptunius]SFI51267.1 Uncharacterized conserved protein YbaA, DUF1428 family [Celeribacter neptunius]